MADEFGQSTVNVTVNALETAGVTSGSDTQARSDSDNRLLPVHHSQRCLTLAPARLRSPGPCCFLRPGGDPRTPDIVVIPNVGVVYTGSTKKQSEHGGYAWDDTNVMLLVSNPSIKPRTDTSFVETDQVAPTENSAVARPSIRPRSTLSGPRARRFFPASASRGSNSSHLTTFADTH